jgi:hypothetical protein
MKRYLAALFAVVVLAGTAVAQPYNLRGAFNGWGETPMVDNLDGTYSLTVGGLTPGSDQEFKVAQNDWASSWPGSNAKTVANALGQMTVHFRPGAVGDGWNPAADRVGWEDPGAFTWEILGGFNGWSSEAAGQMTSLGGGLYSVDYTIASAGSYAFKFRKTGDWAYSIGGDFGNSAGDASVTTSQNNQVMRFVLDFPNGRWQTVAIPEPTTIVFAMCSIAAMTFFGRRRKR